MTDQRGSDVGRSSKQERREARRRAAAARKRRTNLVRAAVVAAVLMPAALWVFDRSGPEEIVQAEVLRTSLWRHRPADGRPHTHSRAFLIIEGLNEVSIDRGDGLNRGDRVEVWIRRGRLSRWPYFVERASERGAAPGGAETAEPAPDAAGAGGEPSELPLADPQPGGDPEGDLLPEDGP